MSVTREELKAGIKNRVRAVFADGKKGSTAATDKFILPNEDLGIVTEMLNMDAPVKAYTGVTITGQGAASVEVKYDVYNDNWTKKVKKGSTDDGGADVIITDEIFKWNVSNQKEESMSAYDIKRGTPAVLGERMSVSSIKFLQGSQKAAFQKFVDETTGTSTATAKGSAVTIDKMDITSRDKISEFKIKLVQSITKFAIDNEIDPGDLVVTLNPITFDALAENGLIGDRATQTFAGGQYTVGALAGYKVQSGGMYLPSTTAADSLGGKSEAVEAFVGTSQVGLHSVDFVAANAGKLGLSNDQGTYLEMADISGVLDYKANFGKAQSLVISSK